MGKLSKTIVGIDLGKQGALVCLHNGKIIDKIVMPLIADEDVDVNVVLKFIQLAGKDCHVIMERFGGFFGYDKKSVASLSRQSGFIETTLLLNNIAHTRVMPQVWQKVMFADTKVFHKPNGHKDTKKMALLTINRLMPKETFLATARSSVPHNGMVDAALLALFGNRRGI